MSICRRMRTRSGCQRERTRVHIAGISLVLADMVNTGRALQHDNPLRLLAKGSKCLATGIRMLGRKLPFEPVSGVSKGGY